MRSFFLPCIPAAWQDKVTFRKAELSMDFHSSYQYHTPQESKRRSKRMENAFPGDAFVTFICTPTPLFYIAVGWVGGADECQEGACPPVSTAQKKKETGVSANLPLLI